MAIIKGKVNIDLDITEYKKDQLIKALKEYDDQINCKHDGDIIEESLIHPHDGHEITTWQCFKCGKIL